MPSVKGQPIRILYFSNCALFANTQGDLEP